MVDVDFKYELSRNRIYDKKGSGLEGKAWLYTGKGLNSVSDLAAFGNSFEKYYTEELARLGWTQYFVWNDLAI